MSIMGIDPGTKGGIGFIDDEGKPHVYDIPIRTIQVMRKNKKTGKMQKANAKRVDSDKFGELVDRLDPDFILLEKVGVMSGQGISSSGAFMRAYGIAEGVAGGLGIDLMRITPRVWKSKYGLKREKGEKKNDFKDRSRLKAIELFPELSDQLKLKKDVDKAEALLIAMYGSL